MNMRIMAGRLKGRIMKFDKSLCFRPMQSIVKKALFDVLRPKIGPGQVFIDLFGGTGSVGVDSSLALWPACRTVPYQMHPYKDWASLKHVQMSTEMIGPHKGRIGPQYPEIKGPWGQGPWAI